MTDLTGASELARRVFALDPAWLNNDMTIAELAWIFSSSDTKGWHTNGWTARGDTVAFAKHQPPNYLSWLVHPRHPELIDEVLDWFEALVDEDVLNTDVRSTNPVGIETLERRGYQHDPTLPWGYLNARTLDAIEEPVLPDGYRLTTMAEHGEVHTRAEAHRIVWDPSKVTDERYERVMNTWPYRPDLDFLVVADGGEITATALGWYDEGTRTMEYEPVGTHPDHRRKGLGRAVNLFGLHKAKAAGATRALVGCRGDDEWPIPRQLYWSVGFEVFLTELRYVKRR